MKYALTTLWIVLCPAVFAADLDLYVTDYDENPRRNSSRWSRGPSRMYRRSR